MFYLKAFWRLMRLTIDQYMNQNISWMAAALAYYTLFSLAPTFIVVVAVGGHIFSEELVKGEIVNQLGSIIGMKSAMTVQRMIETGQDLATISWANLFGLFLVIFAATNVFTQLRSTLTTIYSREGRSGNVVKLYLLDRILSVGMILSIGLLLMALVLVEITLSGFDSILSTYLPVFHNVYLWQLGTFAVSLVVVTLLFMVVYRVVPAVKIAWMDVLPGAALTSLLFNIAKFLITMYISTSRTITLFGAASSFVVILLWVYFSAQLVLLGAAFCRHYAVEFGSWKPQPVSDGTVSEC